MDRTASTDWVAKLVEYVEQHPGKVPDRARDEVSTLVALQLLTQAKAMRTLYEAGVFVNKRMIDDVREILFANEETVGKALLTLGLIDELPPGTSEDAG